MLSCRSLSPFVYSVFLSGKSVAAGRKSAPMVMYGSNYPTVSGDFVITAYYQETLRQYTVSWFDANGRLIEEDTGVDYGTTPSYDGNVPTKASTAQYEYVFKGWNDGTNDYVTNPQGSDVAVALPTVNGPMNFTAIFYENVRSYTVNFYAGRGGVTAPPLLYSYEVPYGEVPVYSGETPTQTATAQYEYVFAGWTNVSSGTTPLASLPAVTGTVRSKRRSFRISARRSNCSGS